MSVRILAGTALLALLLWPLAAFPEIGMGDYLNHLARMHILAAITTSPDLHSHYEVHWAPIPYLAMDGIVSVLAGVFPVDVAGRLFIGMCVLMPAISASLLHRAVHGRWSALPASCLLIGYSYVLSLGFLNFAFSAGLGVMLFAAWIAAGGLPRWRRSALFCLPVLLLYLGHAFACLGYCLAVAGYEVSRAARTRGASPGIVAADWLAAAAQALPVLLLASRLDLHQAYLGPLFDRYGTVVERITGMISPFVFRFSAADGLVVVCMILTGLMLRRRLRLAGPVWPAAAAVAIASLCVPTVLRSTWGTDLRLPLIAAILLLGGLSWRIEPGKAGRAALFAALAALIAIRSADVAKSLGPAAREIRDARAVLAALPRGARLLLADADGPRSESDVSLSTKWQMGLLAVIDRDAFVPTLFTGMTTVRPVQHMIASSTPNGLPLSPVQLQDGLSRTDQGRPPQDDGKGARIYWLGWPTKFDYLLVQHHRSEFRAPAGLVRVAASPSVDLYRIDIGRP